MSRLTIYTLIALGLIALSGAAYAIAPHNHSFWDTETRCKVPVYIPCTAG